MIRRSFRFGLWLGLLAGIAFALSRLFRSQAPPATIDLGERGGSLGSTPEAWPPLEAPMASPAPVQVPEPEVEPAAASDGADEPGLILIGDEPLQTPPEAVPTTLSAPPPAPAAPATPATPATQKQKLTVKKSAAKKAAPKKKLDPWVAPDGNVCPSTHPVKAKLKSGIFQVPGNFAYERTSPDRCYQSAEAAEKDGLRAAKR